MILGMSRNCFLPCNVFPLEWCIVCVFLRIMYRSLSWFLKCGFFFFNLKSEGVTRSFHFFAVLQFEIRSSLMLYLGLRVRQLQVMILKIMKIAKMKRKLRTKKRRARTRR